MAGQIDGVADLSAEPVVGHRLASTFSGRSVDDVRGSAQSTEPMTDEAQAAYLAVERRGGRDDDQRVRLMHPRQGCDLVHLLGVERAEGGERTGRALGKDPGVDTDRVDRPLHLDLKAVCQSGEQQRHGEHEPGPDHRDQELPRSIAQVVQGDGEHQASHFLRATVPWSIST